MRSSRGTRADAVEVKSLSAFGKNRGWVGWRSLITTQRRGAMVEGLDVGIVKQQPQFEAWDWGDVDE
jgi:hypothetical protein